MLGKKLRNFSHVHDEKFTSYKIRIVQKQLRELRIQWNEELSVGQRKISSDGRFRDAGSTINRTKILLQAPQLPSTSQKMVGDVFTL